MKTTQARFARLALRCPMCGEYVNPGLRPGRGKPFNVVRQCSTLTGCQRYFRLVGRTNFTHSTHRTVTIQWFECDRDGSPLLDGWQSSPCAHSQSVAGVDLLHDDRPCPECIPTPTR